MKRAVQSFSALFRRNLKLYFKDPMTFFVSLITPIILLVLFITFLRSSYEQTVLDIVGDFAIEQKLLDGFTGGWLFSSVLATSCITVSFCSGVMIVDKINNADTDFLVTPVPRYLLQLSYCLANLVSTLLVCFALLSIGLIYLAIVGFYLTLADVLLVIVDVLLTSAFASMLANLIWSFTRSQGVNSGICTLVSALYGFICGAYMPIASMGEGVQNFTALLPGTYSTVLFRRYFLEGALKEMEGSLPLPLVEGIRDGFDVNFYFFGMEVPMYASYLIVAGAAILMLLLFVLVSILQGRGTRK